MKNRARNPKLKGVYVNPLRLDPTRTTTLRRAAIADVRRRFARLALAIDELIVRQDSFGLNRRRNGPPNPFKQNAFCPTGEGGGVDPTCSPTEQFAAKEKASFSDVTDDPDLVKLYEKTADEVPWSGLTAKRDQQGQTGEFFKGTVSGLRVKTDVPNEDSLSGYDEETSLTLKGIREVPMSVFEDASTKTGYTSKSDEDKTNRIAEQIRENGWVSPLIVVKDAKGYFVLEGSHRYEALKRLGVKTIPAKVLIDHSEDVTTNAFCPTGPGGGVDPTCSPSGEPLLESVSKGMREYVTGTNIDHLRESNEPHAEDLRKHVASSKGTSKTVYRGEFRLDDPPKVGDTIDLGPLRSFSEKEGVADQFIRIGAITAKSLGVTTGHKVMYEVRGLKSGAKVLSDQLGDVESEWLSSGSLKVRSVEKRGDSILVKAEHLPPVSLATNVSARIERRPEPTTNALRREGPPSPFKHNAFCPTGKGGGIDNSCSSSDGGESGWVPVTSSVSPSEGFEVLKDEDGKEYELYHGSNKDFDSFKTGITGGQFLTSSRETADLYTESDSRYMYGDMPSEVEDELINSPDKTIYKVRAYVKKTASDREWRDAQNEAIDLLPDAPGYKQEKKAIQLLKKQGFDSVRTEDIDDSKGPTETVIVFNPKNVRIVAKKNVSEKPKTNAFCPTGPGGGVDPTCGRESFAEITGVGAGGRGWTKKIKLSARATALREDDDWQLHTDVLTVVDGKRKGGFTESEERSTKSEVAKAMRAMKKHGFDKDVELISVSGKGLIAVHKSAPDLDRSKFVSAATKYLKHGHSKGMTVDEERILGKMLGFPAIGTDWITKNEETTTNERWELKSSPEQLAAFQEWLKKQLKWYVIGMTEDQLWSRYVEEGFRKGAGRAFDDVRSRRGKSFRSDDFLQGERRQFFATSFRRPETVEKVKILASRTFEELTNVGEEIRLKLGRTLTDGLAQGQNPRVIARTMRDQLAIPQRRAETIARTEIIRAHAEGQLAAMEELGIDEVGAMVEWSTAGDDRVCEACLPMEGVVLKLEEATGMIPRHPNCRCAWLPANVGESRREQTRGKVKIERQIDLSARIAGDTFDEGRPIDARRPRALVTPTKNVENAFCPTGPGGGQDNSCSPAGGGVRVPIEQMTGDVKESERLSLPVKEGVKAKNETCSVWGDCTSQAYKAWQRGEGDVYFGWAIPKENLEEAYDYHEKTVKEFGPPKDYYLSVRGMFAHAWNVKDGQLIDHAMGSDNAKDYVYFGKPVSKEILESVKHGDDLAHIDYQTMQMTSK